MPYSNDAQRASRGKRARHTVGTVTLIALLGVWSTMVHPNAVVLAATTPTLKLVDVVSGGAAVPSAWTLNAGTNTDSFSGPGPVVGPSPITAGVAWTMFETGGPGSNYTEGGWACNDPTGAPVSLAGRLITLQAGQNVTCTITNSYATAASATPTPTPTPRPTPGPTATPAPTPAATPAPTPTATPAPTPPPDPPGIAVPATIDATGSTDASSALIAFVNTVPDGSTIVFKVGGVYRMDAALKFAHRHNLTFEGNGATLRANGGTTEASSLFWLGSYAGGNSGILIRNFTLVGNSSTPGVYQSGREGAHGILVDSGSAIEITGVTVRGVWGDCLYVGSAASGVSFHDSTCASNGRNGVTVTSATNLTVQRVAFPTSGYCTFDIEPNVSSESATNIRLLDNTAGTWTNSFVSAEGAAGSIVSGLTVSGNSVTGGSLLTAIALSRRQNIVFTNNRSTVTAAGPVLRFAHIDGLTVTGNIQPLSSGALASITDSTGVISTP